MTRAGGAGSPGTRRVALDAETRMADPDVLAGVRECLAQALDLDADSVRPEARLVDDLGADSLDLLDVTFRLEQKFGVPMNPREAERRARAALGGRPLDVDGVYTPEALDELRRVLPGIPPEEIAPGLTAAELPRRLRVATLAALVERLLDERRE